MTSTVSNYEISRCPSDMEMAAIKNSYAKFSKKWNDVVLTSLFQDYINNYDLIELPGSYTNSNYTFTFSLTFQLRLMV